MVIRALNFLRSRLDMAFGRDPLAAAAEWSQGAAMGEALAQVRRVHDRVEGGTASPDKIALAVANFRRSGELPGFVDLKYVCLAIATVDQRGDCLLAQAALRDQVLLQAETLAEPRRQMKCFQALLRSYWSFPLHAQRLPEAAIQGFVLLRAWLARRHAALEQTRMAKPDWFALLSMHANLLGEQPCERYGVALLEGRGAPLQLAIDDLAIAADSWVHEEALLALMDAATRLDDAAFQARLPRLLALARGEADLTVSPALAQRCLARLLWRYARCSVVAEHVDLFESALALLGNPSLQRATWDDLVQDAMGAADDLAREMLGSWIKRRLIADFFQRLASEGNSDRRRLEYWLRYEPFIADMWFVLTPADQARPGRAYDDFRRYARGRVLERCADGADAGARAEAADVGDAASDVGNWANPAGSTDQTLLLMRLNDFLVIEFADPAQAMQLLRWDSLAAEQLRLLLGAEVTAQVSAAQLAALRCELALAHRDALGSKWERKFDDYIRPIIWQAP